MTLDEQYLDLRNKYPYLYFFQEKDVIKGTIFIEGKEFQDSYEVEIILSPKYPQQLPRARETELKIPDNYHHNMPEGTLCLETPFTIHKIFRQNETLLNYVDNLLVPFLHGYSCYSRYGKAPSGEHAHGAEGVLEDYKVYFKVPDDLKALRLLSILAEDNYRGHHLCPCGSNNIIRKCHGSILLEMKTVGYYFMQDYIRIIDYLKKKGVNVSSFVSNKFKSAVKELQSSPNNKWGY